MHWFIGRRKMLRLYFVRLRWGHGGKGCLHDVSQCHYGVVSSRQMNHITCGSTSVPDADFMNR